MQVTFNKKTEMQEVTVVELREVELPYTVTMEVSVEMAALIRKLIGVTNCRPDNVTPGLDKSKLESEVYELWINLGDGQNLYRLPDVSLSTRDIQWSIIEKN